MDITALASPHGWASIAPSLIAIGAAFITRQVFFSLFLGIWAGAFILSGLDIHAVLPSLLSVADTYLVRALVPKDGSIDHMAVAMFTLMTGGMIGVISANGGMRGVVEWLTRFAYNRARGQVATFFMGFVVFFDDYANTLIVGKTMRPLTDRLAISREKLAFLVDATAAPLACIALVTTWIGFQLSLIDGAIADIDVITMGSYELFLQSLPFSFYPILMLIFIGMIIATGRDFGPMYRAEKRMVDEKNLQGKDALGREGTNAINAALPILVLIATTVGGLFVTGQGESVRQILGSADPFKSMLWASLLGLIAAIAITLIRKSLSVAQVVEAMEDGFKPMLLAVMILTFAWAIADINKELQTANFIVSQLGDTMPPWALPAVIFVIAALTAFATGTSWGTMGILVPLVLPLSVSLLAVNDLLDSEHWYILYASLAGIMAGAVWGDHCSPISDTTILSSLASDCSHIEHVRTQMPYALAVAGVALVVGLIPSGLGVSPLITMPLAAAMLYFILRYFGTKVTQ